MQTFLQRLGIREKEQGNATGSSWYGGSTTIESFSPVDGLKIGSVQACERDTYQNIVQAAQDAFLYWRSLPAPRRGDIVRQIGDALRHYKEPLGQLVSYEMGKSLQEGLGEVQEMIDICDFAVGLVAAVVWAYHAQRTPAAPHV